MRFCHINDLSARNSLFMQLALMFGSTCCHEGLVDTIDAAPVTCVTVRDISVTTTYFT